MWGIRTWKIFAGDNFLGYEYAKEEDEVHDMSIKKFGASENWGVSTYTVELIPWPTVE